MDQKRFSVKSLLPYGIAILVFLALTLVYASPILNGKVLLAGDVKSAEGMSREFREYKEKTSEISWWTGSMFCGMPTYHIGGPVFPCEGNYYTLRSITTLSFTGVLSFILSYFICFFILLRSFKINTWLSIVGSIAISLSSYFFIIIAAGHNTKAETIAFMAPVIAGFYLIFQKKYLLGSIFTIVYTCLGMMRHPQMAYYICLLIGILFMAEVYIHIKEKRYKDLGIASLLFCASLLVGIGTNYPRYSVNQEYVSETMRGGHSELVKESDAGNKTEGLDLDYATAWSYGVGETFTLMIPGFMGNASGYDVGKNSEVFDSLVKHGVSKRQALDYCKNMPTYWGDQPFTAGPVYVGAIICFLFVLGLCIVEGPYKWALLAATVLSVLLSWGHNFMPLTEFFFKYVPMYNKFRAVSSILVVAEVTIPLLGFLALKRIMEEKIDKAELVKKTLVSAGVTGGLCLFFALLGGTFLDFTSVNDERSFGHLPEWLVSSIMDERKDMMSSDAWRSFMFIAIALGLLLTYVHGKIKSWIFVSLLGVFILADMWPVNKRFFNNDNFVSAKDDSSYFKKQPWEEQLLSSESDPNYRVLNLTTNTFNESRTSYYFKSIGGYHAAKLRRYQDLIEEHISKFNMPVLNMLNTKYIITKTQDGNVVPQRNPDAMGNAWFVDSLMVVNTPNEESEALRNIDLRHTAVTDAKFASFVKSNLSPDTTATVRELSYAPNRLEYESQSEKDGTIVFSEVYYPYGWKAFVDDVEIPHFRVNYLLRALNVPSGKHSIRFVFEPESIKKATPVAVVCYIILYALILLVIGKFVYGLVRSGKSETK